MSESQRSHAYSHESVHRQAHGLAHQSNLAFSTFMDHDAQRAVRPATYLGWSSPPAVDLDAVPKLIQLNLARLWMNPDQVLAWNLVLWMEQTVG